MIQIQYIIVNIINTTFFAQKTEKMYTSFPPGRFIIVSYP